MRFSRASLLAATFILCAHALPRPKPEVTYSVVNVDGGSQTTPTPTIIYQTITQSDDTPATISVTVTDHQTQWTSAQTTQTHTDTATALIPEVSASPDGHPTHHMPRPKPTTVISEGATVTITSVLTPSPTTTKYYDNGQWHTSYAVKNWSSVGGSHPGQWAFASSGVASASGSAAPSGGY